MRSWRRVFQGVAFVGVLAVMLWLIVQSFQGRFVDAVPVTLKVDRAGTQLEKYADVKLRGIVVGRVTKQRTTGDGAELTLELDPDQVELIPADVEARLLPKTLFGEKYVALVTPDGGGRGRIQAGDVIPEDRSQSALEVERVLADLFPLLRSLEPEKLNRALTAIADGLRGQGDQLGRSLENLDRYLARIEPELPTIQRDLSGLADLAESLGAAAPDLLRLAENSITSARTLTEKEDVLVSFLRGTSGFTDTLTAILDRDGRNLVELAESSRSVLEVVYGRRAVLQPTVKGLRLLATELNDALDDENALNIRLELVPSRGFYTQPCDYPNCNRGDASATPAYADTVGSEAEQQVLRELLAPVLRVAPEDVPQVVDVLYGPLLRGNRVSAR